MEVAETPEGDEEPVLDGVVCGVAVAEQTESERVERGAVPLQQRTERRGIAASGQPQEVGIGDGHTRSHAVRMHDGQRKFA